MRQQVKSVLWFGLTLDVVIIGGTILARIFYNEAPAEFHQFVEMSLWATMAAGILCIALVFQIYKMTEESKKARSKVGNTNRVGPPQKTMNKGRNTDNSALLGILIIAPGAVIIIPFIHGSVAFGHDYVRLMREFWVFLALWFCFRIFALTKKSLKKVPV
jgi:hypothetical protein